LLLGHAHRDERNGDHHGLRDHDGDGDEARRVALFVAHHRKPVKRQHRAVAEMKAGQRGREHQQRLVL